MVPRDYKGDADHPDHASRSLATIPTTTNNRNKHDKNEDNEVFLLVGGTTEWMTITDDAQIAKTFALRYHHLITLETAHRDLLLSLQRNASRVLECI